MRSDHILYFFSDPLERHRNAFQRNLYKLAFKPIQGIVNEDESGPVNIPDITQTIGNSCTVSTDPEVTFWTGLTWVHVVVFMLSSLLTFAAAIVFCCRTKSEKLLIVQKDKVEAADLGLTPSSLQSSQMESKASSAVGYNVSVDEIEKKSTYKGSPDSLKHRRTAKQDVSTEKKRK